MVKNHFLPLSPIWAKGYCRHRRCPSGRLSTFGFHQFRGERFVRLNPFLQGVLGLGRGRFLSKMGACVRVPCCDFQYGHHLEIGLRQGAEGLRPLCGAIFYDLVFFSCFWPDCTTHCSLLFISLPKKSRFHNFHWHPTMFSHTQAGMSFWRISISYFHLNSFIFHD